MGSLKKVACFVHAVQPLDLTAAFTSAKMAGTCGYRQNDSPSTSPTEEDSAATNNIQTLTQV